MRLEKLNERRLRVGWCCIIEQGENKATTKRTELVFYFRRRMTLDKKDSIA
jgi:hypothetical protein